MKYSRLIYLASPCFSNFERIFLQSKYFPSSIAFNVVFFVFMISQEHFNPNQNITAPKLLDDERFFISKKRMHFTSSRSHFINSYCCPFSLYTLASIKMNDEWSNSAFYWRWHCCQWCSSKFRCMWLLCDGMWDLKNLWITWHRITNHYPWPLTTFISYFGLTESPSIHHFCVHLSTEMPFIIPIAFFLLLTFDVWPFTAIFH